MPQTIVAQLLIGRWEHFDDACLFCLRIQMMKRGILLIITITESPACGASLPTYTTTTNNDHQYNAWLFVNCHISDRLQHNFRKE